MTDNGLVAFDANDAEATCANFPDLAFLWCFLFHVIKIADLLILSMDFFIYFLTRFFQTSGSTRSNWTRQKSPPLLV